jgi:hypothetical protein
MPCTRNYVATNGWLSKVRNRLTPGTASEPLLQKGSKHTLSFPSMLSAPEAVFAENVRKEAPLATPHAVVEDLEEICGCAEHTPTVVAPVSGVQRPAGSAGSTRRVQGLRVWVGCCAGQSSSAHCKVSRQYKQGHCVTPSVLLSKYPGDTQCHSTPPPPPGPAGGGGGGGGGVGWGGDTVTPSAASSIRPTDTR